MAANSLTKEPDAKEDIALFEDAKRLRQPYEEDWKMAAAYCRPRSYNIWIGGSNPANRGHKADARRYAFDSTGAKSLPKWTSILTRLITPTNMKYQQLEASDDSLRNDFRTKIYLSALCERLFKRRYEARARFVQSNGETFNSLGLYGCGPVYVGKRKPTLLDRRGGVFYRACRMYDCYVLLDDEGNLDTFFRRFWLNARQFKKKWPKLTPEQMPISVRRELEKPDPSESNFFEFVHIVHARSDYDPQKLGKSKPFVGEYAHVQDKCYVGEEESYPAFPYLFPRTDTDSDEPYGYSPALQALPSMGSTNAMKKSALKQGQRSVEPPLLTYDDGVLHGGLDVRPNKVIHGGLDSQGRELIKPLQLGNFNLAEKLIQAEREDIEDAFLVKLFQVLQDNPNMSATAVIELIAKESSLVAPLMGRLQAEYLGPMTEIELAYMTELGDFADLDFPPALREAEGEYNIVYTSPLAKGMYAEEVSGYLRTFETAVGAAQATGDLSLLDPFNLKVAIPEIADRQSAPARWMNDQNAQKQIAAERAKAQQQKTLIENAPGLAGAAKAVADMQKNANGAQQQ